MPAPSATHRLLRLGAALCALHLGACAHRQGPSTSEPRAPVGYSDAPLMGAQSGPTLDPGATPAERVVRLDRLLDLFDAARFGADEGARESFWEGLGGAAMGRGPEATREGIARLLDIALALEADDALDADQRDFVASAILLLTTDLHRPTLAEDLSIQTAAYRELVASGHPRIADNAHWRLYDHIRGCLAGAVAAPPGQRPEIAVHSLYAAEESIEGLLDDKRSVHARPALPPPASLWAMVERERDALSGDPRWAPVIKARAAADAELRATALASLPAPRDPTWEVASMPAGVGRAESLAPVVIVLDEELVIDAGRPQEIRARLGSPEAARALESALVSDGRGVVLFVARPMLPSPALRTALFALLSARVSTVEIAIREPRVGDEAGDVIVAVPLEIVRESDQGPASNALRKARIHVHLDGRGPRLAIDGRWLAARPQGERELGELLASLDRAYPRERMITLTLGDDVLLQQLLDLLKALVGGPDRRYDVAAWSVDRKVDAIAEGKPADAEDRRLALRSGLYSPKASASITQPFPLPGGDQPRLEAMARQLTRCLPEVEGPLSAAGITLRMSFEEGRRSDLKILGKVKKARHEAITACVDDESRGFRLREQRDPVTLDIVLRPGS
ncbi:MAG: hypothetical protein H6710_05025 [Myxococcales bacterium]|nr:hypothetical protein [Myxococcales bacterium]MCB9705586.1 hypothetical protein [Myxococcales bacterium]